MLDEGVGVFNGDMGVITDISDYDEELTILFDDGRESVYNYKELDQIEHAFAVTIHKSQGSEYPAVIIPLLGGNRKLMNRNLIYTAITRARQLVTRTSEIGHGFGTRSIWYVTEKLGGNCQFSVTDKYFVMQVII